MYVTPYERQQSLNAAEAYVQRNGPFKTDVDHDRFVFYEASYPVWPRKPREGLYSYRFKVEDRPHNLSFSDIDPDDQMDPLYYTPERCKHLKKAYEQKRNIEKFNLTLIRSPVPYMKNVAYRTMQCELSNIDPNLNSNVADGLIYNPMFSLEGDRRTTRFKDQMREMYEFYIDPQHMVILDAVLCLKELGVYHHLDCQSLIDLLHLSMVHPNAYICHSCRHIDWLYVKYDEEFIMCMNPECKFGSKRRDLPVDEVVALPFHGFNLQHYFEQVFPDKK
jgi:hypothetical protein